MKQNFAVKEQHGIITKGHILVTCLYCPLKHKHRSRQLPSVKMYLCKSRVTVNGNSDRFTGNTSTKEKMQDWGNNITKLLKMVVSS